MRLCVIKADSLSIENVCIPFAARSVAPEKRSKFQCNDWGTNEKVELAIVRERFKLAATVAQLGWQLCGLRFKATAQRLHPGSAFNGLTPFEQHNTMNRLD